MASQHSPLRRSPTQSRATATLRAIREAALRILKEEGHARLTTNRIAEVAGISIGSLYQYYADKHSIAADICNELLTSELDEIRRLVAAGYGIGCLPEHVVAKDVQAAFAALASNQVSGKLVLSVDASLL